MARWLGVQATPISHPRTVSDKKVVFALYVLSSVDDYSKKANTDAALPIQILRVLGLRLLIRIILSPSEKIWYGLRGAILFTKDGN